MRAKLIAIGAIATTVAVLTPAVAQADPLPANCKSAMVYDGEVEGAQAWCVGGSSGQFRIAVHCFRSILPSYWTYGPWRNVTSTDRSKAMCTDVTAYVQSFHVAYK
jgi:hypothetical protein